jgi:C4-type Zn-finger protein
MMMILFHTQGPHGELGLEKAKSSAKPTFVTTLEGCLVSDLACGYGHTLFVLRDDDEEDKKAAERLQQVHEEDVQDLVEKNKGSEKKNAVSDKKSSGKKKAAK